MKKLIKTFSISMLAFMLMFAMAAPTNVNAACSHKKSETIVTKQPTCTKTGKAIRECTKCGKQLGSKTLPMLGHKTPYGSKVTKKPTCTDSGKGINYCKRCGATVYYAKIDPLGHSYKTISCVKTKKKVSGFHEYKTTQKCSRCGKIRFLYHYK